MTKNRLIVVGLITVLLAVVLGVAGAESSGVVRGVLLALGALLFAVSFWCYIKLGGPAGMSI